MPPKIKYSKEQIIESAIEIVRKNGIENLSARNIANNLNSSPQPIFSYFKNMEELKNSVFEYAYNLYLRYNNEHIKSGNKEINVSDVIKVIMKNLDMSEEIANLFHFEIWTFVHGIASMHITNSLHLNEEEISGIITDVYEGLKVRFKEK